MNNPTLLMPPPSAEPKDAFANLMRDHADLVYSAARRQLGNSTMADDVVQAVFLLLWKKIGSIKGQPAGWLIKTTHFACRDARKLAARRQFHEHAAAAIRPEHSTMNNDPGWENYSQVLDEAMTRLQTKDRDAIALRYLRGLSFKQVGDAIGTEEEAAKKRVTRAVARLRETIQGKAPVPAAAVLATQLESHGIQAAPQSLVTSMTASAGSSMKGSFAGAIAKSVEAKEFWLAPKIAAAVLLILAGLACLVYVVIDLNSTGPAEPPQTSTNQPAEGPAAPIVLNIRATIDGNDVLNITPAGAQWQHYSWKEPTGVVINGAHFDIHAGAPLDKIGLADADLSSAQVLQRSGRGTVAMEKTGAGIAIHFSDDESGAAPYTIRITFALKSATPIPPPAPASAADSVFLDVKATISGSDILTITHEGAVWRHVAMFFPTNVSLSGRPWDTRTPLNLDDIGLTSADLSSAQVISHTGRDTVAMENTTGGIAIYFGDAPGGASDYEIKIRFAKLKPPKP